jgi:hypothetical protein
MSTKSNQARVVIKGFIPKSLKLQFKLRCVQHGLKMGEVLEVLVKQWIQANGSTSSFTTQWHNSSDEEAESVKGQVSLSLKTEFKSLCTQRKVTQCFTVYNLIRKWVEANHEDTS